MKRSLISTLWDTLYLFSAGGSNIEVVFGHIPFGKEKSLKISKDIFQYMHNIDTLCLPGDVVGTEMKNSVLISVEYAALGVNKFLASHFGIVAVPVSPKFFYILGSEKHRYLSVLSSKNQSYIGISVCWFNFLQVCSQLLPATHITFNDPISL